MHNPRVPGLQLDGAHVASLFHRYWQYEVAKHIAAAWTERIRLWHFQNQIRLAQQPFALCGRLCCACLLIADRCALLRPTHEHRALALAESPFSREREVCARG